MGAANTGGTGDSKSVTKKKAEKDTEVSAYEKELAKQEAEKKAEANVEMGLGTPSTNIIDGTLSDPREKDDTAAIQSIKDSKKTTTTNIGNNGNDNNNTIKQVTETAPTVSEVSQATTTEADADTEANRLLKIKKKGRSESIISGSQGVTKMAADYSLGKKSLLGRV
jgi:hypothetical protein